MDIVDILKKGGVVIMPTDTIYGIVGSALNQKTVEKIYTLRKRATNKPFIILISSINDLAKFEINLSEKHREFLQKNWPNPLSVVLECNSKNFEYLPRGTNSLAFRMPKDKKLLEILKQTGPLVAPSANFEGKKPAKSIAEAKKYFGNKVDLYIDGGDLIAKPSTLIVLIDTEFELLREGSISKKEIKKLLE